MATVAALLATTPALLALSISTASAGTSSGHITCTNPAGTPAGTPDAPFDLNFTATPPATAPPTGAPYSVTGNLTVTVPGAVLAGFKANAVTASTTAVAFSGGKFALDATRTTGALTMPILGAKPAVDITNYNAAAGTADDISFTFTGVTFSGATTAGANNDTVVVSLSANQAASGLALKLMPSGLNLGWGAPGMGGLIQSTGGTCHAVAPFSSLGSTTLSSPGSTPTPSPTPTPPPAGTQTFANTAKPKVVGTVKVGKTLTCKPGSWSPAPATTSFRWLRDGKAIKKAARSRYKVVLADAKHRLSCRVAVAAPGVTPATATSGRTAKVPLPKR
ncbi:hypothetical protein GON03_09725 [Nocardioides sp. MAH-18]|uniref:Ig-like domain-containing protein n=1 Tax=Nocardioides agri TaxID=2682843 RepID=A0A6L6XQ47_9ACTN|nr:MULTISPECIES: hypothetical protein [unclassified Nocardioides]MBA2954604.1 hypothetical protein [Nocardioides sp. CGMCC 1.13656]MVQ49461.1 hypothetical protein [Nocardioides sp. MAH-18]